MAVNKKIPDLNPLTTIDTIDLVVVEDVSADETKHIEWSNLKTFLHSELDHGSLQGLVDDDHTMYVRADGIRPFTAVVAGVTPTQDAHLATKEYVDTLIAGLDWQDSVLDRDLSTPPGSPSTGDRYIVASGGTGDWSGHDDKIAEWNGSSWDFTVPSEGTTAWVEDETITLRYTSSAWITVGSGLSDHGALSGLGDDDHTMYSRVDGTRAFTAVVGGVTPTAASHLATKSYVDGEVISDHGALSGLTNDDHFQYVLLAGRSGGQTVIGGTAASNTLDLQSTSHATRGPINAKDRFVIKKTATHDANYDNGNSGTAKTIDWNNGNLQKVTLNDNCTFTFTSPTDNKPGVFYLQLIQDATGSRTVTWPGAVKWPNKTAPTLTTNALAKDYATFIFDGTDYYAAFGPDFG